MYWSVVSLYGYILAVTLHIHSSSLPYHALWQPGCWQHRELTRQLTWGHTSRGFFYQWIIPIDLNCKKRIIPWTLRLTPLRLSKVPHGPRGLGVTKYEYEYFTHITNNYYEWHFVIWLQELKLIFRQTKEEDEKTDRRGSWNNYLDDYFNFNLCQSICTVLCVLSVSPKT